MAQLAQSQFEEKNSDWGNVDAALEELLSMEYEIYRQKHDDFGSSFLKEATSLASDGSYPEVRGLIEDFRHRVAEGEDPVYALDGASATGL